MNTVVSKIGMIERAKRAMNGYPRTKPIPKVSNPPMSHVNMGGKSTRCPFQLNQFAKTLKPDVDLSNSAADSLYF